MKRLIKKGFSMVELLFVMVVLAALAAIAIPNMSSGANSAALINIQKQVIYHKLFQLKLKLVSQNF
jgi:prepilin-type N-terminal cleavage/methylation domain-containing protein